MEQTHILYIFPTWSISIPIGWIRYPLGCVFLVIIVIKDGMLQRRGFKFDEITNGSVDDFYKCSWLFFPGQSFHIYIYVGTVHPLRKSFVSLT